MVGIPEADDPALTPHETLRAHGAVPRQADHDRAVAADAIRVAPITAQGTTVFRMTKVEPATRATPARRASIAILPETGGDDEVAVGRNSDRCAVGASRSEINESALRGPAIDLAAVVGRHHVSVGGQGVVSKKRIRALNQAERGRLRTNGQFRIGSWFRVGSRADA